MTKVDFNRLKDLFMSAQPLTGSERARFLESQCADDLGLRDELRAFLDAETVVDDFLIPPSSDSIAASMGLEPDELEPGARLGAYEIETLIATGGMGAVYLARRADDAFDKRVAIKTLAQNIAAPRMKRRFQLERQALANLDHPNITRLLDGGATADGMPFLVMEYVEGQPIDRYCDDNRLSIPQRLELFATVCDAVQYAHQNLIVHRDLKPSNILVNGAGEVKLLDFGIARLLDTDTSASQAQATVTGLRAMTPAYSSPEQVRGANVTTSTDVYSLGVVLYELLTGQRPLDIEDLTPYDADRIVCETEAAPPSAVIARSQRSGDSSDASVAASRGEPPAKLRRTLIGDLDNIALMALRKDPSRRYASPERLSADIRRYLAGQPVTAQRDTLRYRAGKFIGRNKPQVVAAGIAALALIVGTSALAFGLVRAREAQRSSLVERNAAIEAEAAAQDVLTFYQNMMASTNPYRQGRTVTMTDLLKDAEQRLLDAYLDKPLVEAGIRRVLGHSYISLMGWRDAERHLRPAIELYRQLDGSHDLVIAECLSMVGRAITQLNNPEAIEMQREALAIRRKHFGAEHPLVAESTGNLGFALWDSSPGSEQWDEAERHYREALAMFERLGIGGCRDAARLTLSLGYMFDHKGGQDEPAETYYRKAVNMYADLPITEDKYELATLGLFANLLERNERYAEAAELLELYRANFPVGIQLDQQCKTTWRLGRAYAQQSMNARADAEYRTALAFECERLADTNAEEAPRLLALALELRAAATGESDLFVETLTVLESLQTPLTIGLDEIRTDLAALRRE